MNRILIDSGPLIALFNGNDTYHAASVAFIRANQSELVSTIASLTETLHLLNFSRKAQIDFLEWVSAAAVTIEPIENADLPRIIELTKKYADLPMDFADACLVFLAEKLDIDTIATIDRDFDVYRIEGKRPFTILIK